MLDRFPNLDNGTGNYALCQQALMTKADDQNWVAELLNKKSTAENCRYWIEVLQSKSVLPPIAVNQLFVGNQLAVNDLAVNCGALLTYFGEHQAIPKVCVNCFKVQILTTDLVALIEVYFALRLLKLPRDNSRKCMIEIRKDVPYPYKGYIYCESDDDAVFCREEMMKLFRQFEIKNAYLAISHGCSEYGLKYPEFKYSPAGEHRDFKRPATWDDLETKYLPPADKADSSINFNKNTITLRDVVGFQTWAFYAESIGDESFRELTGSNTPKLPMEFLSKVRDQAQSRSEQRLELIERMAESN